MATQAIAAQTGFEYGRKNIDRLLDRNQALMAAQQRARRGPTPEVLFVKRIDNSRLVKAADPQRAERDAHVCVRDGAAVWPDHDVWMAAPERDRIRVSHRIGEGSRCNSLRSRTGSFG